jgi:CRP-like cAMP-binding protein
VAAGTVFFAENEKASRILLKRDKMYLLVEGDVALSAKGKPLGAVKPGHIFGEMAAISDAPRSATAVAKKDSRVIGLNDREFKAALKKKPGFALALMSMMIARLRDTLAKLKAAGTIPENEKAIFNPAFAVFDPKHLADLVRGLSNDEPVFYMQGKTILQEGQTATRMYAVLEGTVSVSIAGRTVDRVGPGGVVGELALLDQSTRLATARAETDCTLQPINRNAMLALVKLKPDLGLSLLSALSHRLNLLTQKLKA